MKIVALLSGLLASALAWAAGVFVTDTSAQFLALWPDSVSQQLLAIVVWHTIVAGALVGGVLAVFSPVSGAVLLLAVTGGWIWLALVLPIGFAPQMLLSIAFSLFGAIAAIGATFRGRSRHRLEGRRPTLEELEREAALRLDPVDEPLPAFDLGVRFDPDEPVADDRPMPGPRRFDDGPPHGVSGLLAANLAVLIVLAGAVGVLIYSELRSGDLAAAFSPSGPRASLVSEAAPSLVEQPPPLPLAVEQAPALADLASTGAIAEPEADMETAGWMDPFSYCSAVGTIDYPDRRYAGQIVFPAIADALRVPASTSPDRLKWRCFEGEVLGCASYDRPVCAVTPTVAEMVEFCARNPNARELQAPAGDWACDGTRPDIPANQAWPVDARGFLPGAWLRIVPQPTAS